MKKKSVAKPKPGFLWVEFGISKNAAPQIYDFLLQDCAAILEKAGGAKTAVVLERLEPLSLSYSNLDVSDAALKKIFARFLKSHKLKSAASAYFPKQKTSVKGTVATSRLVEVLADYNLLFDLFFCDIQLQSKRLFVDVMDPFSNVLLARGPPEVLACFSREVKKRLPKTSFSRL